MPDRVGELVEGIKRAERVITSPEGVCLRVPLASRGERMTAFLLDVVFMLAAIICLYFLAAALFASRLNLRVGLTIIIFLSFLIRNMYFLHFELAWQGRTPGKKICGLRVINRSGGPLTPSAVIARNLMREVEFFLPMSIVLNSSSGWSALAAFGWAILVTALPFFNRDRLRAGDIIAGTMVITMPKRPLSADLSAGASDTGVGYAFTEEQLGVYGAFELQVLEELLRRRRTPDVDRLLADVCAKICRKTGIAETIPPQNIRRFLNDFYSAERNLLERGQLFGHFKDDKNSPERKA
jgi:uncharacterized RDD family membrane protein YckC